MKKALLLALMLALPGLAWAQGATEQRSARLLYNYNVASTSYIYCVYTGANDSPWGDALPGVGLIKTTGSSANIAEATASEGSLAGLAVGDLIVVRLPNGTVYTRVIVTYTSAALVVVDAAVDLGTAGVAYTYMKQRCGTAVTDGWIDVSLFWMINFMRDITTITATSIESQVECKVNGIATPVIIETKTIGTTGVWSTPIVSGAWDACRLGVKVTTDGGTQAITARMLYVR